MRRYHLNCHAVADGVDAANLVMLYLLGVVVVALFCGRWPSVVATVINVVSFDLFFIAPRGTLAVSDVQYLLTFAVMLTVGLVIGNLTAGVRYQARVARYREQRTRHLYEMSKALAVGRSPQDIAATSEQFIASTFHARSQVLLPDDNGKLQPLTHPQGMTPWDDAIAQWSLIRPACGRGHRHVTRCTVPDSAVKAARKPTDWWW